MSGMTPNLRATLRQYDIAYYGVTNAADPKHAGGMGVMRTAAQNKAALVAAIASLTRPGLINIPAGYFNLDPGIDLGTFVLEISGAGKYQTQLGCTSGETAAYMFGNPDGTLVEYNRIRDLGIFGGGNIIEGIRIAKCNHTQIFSTLVTGTTGNAIYLGGYSNDVGGNDLFSNTGSGLYLAGTLNNVNAESNRIYANDGVGIFCGSTDTDAGLSINLRGNAIEQNKLAGIIAFNTKALNITQNYFERNAATGYPYHVPEEITVRADIHLLAANGTLLGSVDDAFANKGATVCGNNTIPIGVYSTDPNLNGFVFTTCAYNLRVENNTIFDPTKIDALVCIYRNQSKVIGQLAISGNSVNTVNFIGTYDPATQSNGYAHLIDIADIPNRKNYIDQNFYSYTALTGTTGTWDKSAAKYLGMPVWEMGDGDRRWGGYIDLSIYQELRGQWVWFGCWVNTQGGSTNVHLELNGTASIGTTDFYNASGWVFRSTLLHVGAADASIEFAFEKIGSGPTLLIAHPMLAVVGTPYNKFPVLDAVVWKRAFYPLDGTWDVGDRIINYPPVAGQPKAWVCTVAGAPGTWVSEGNL